MIDSSTSHYMLQIGEFILKFLEIIGLAIVVVALGLWGFIILKVAFRKKQKKQEKKNNGTIQTVKAASVN